MERRQSRAVFAGGVQIGGDAPVSVQSMLNVPAHDVEGNVAQAKSLYEAGCEIIRAAVPDLKSVQLIPALKRQCPSRLWRISILIIALRLPAWRRGWIKSALIRAILAPTSG